MRKAITKMSSHTRTDMVAGCTTLPGLLTTTGLARRLAVRKIIDCVNYTNYSYSSRLWFRFHQNKMVIHQLEMDRTISGWRITPFLLVTGSLGHGTTMPWQRVQGWQLVHSDSYLPEVQKKLSMIITLDCRRRPHCTV